jgi:radical SAM protein with 4Fe4S-binding SPASM domain
MASSVLNMVLGRLPSYTRKRRHLDLLRRYLRPSKLLNMARVEMARLKGDIVVKGLPYIYTVDTGNVCNLKCPLCPTGYHGLERPQSLMRLADFERVLDMIKPYAIEVILHNWGEPFLNPDILPMIRAAKSAGVGTTISSNLNLVHRGEDFLREVVDSGLDHLTVSLDGTTQEVYEKYRVGGEIEQAFHNMKVILDYRASTGRKTPAVEWQYLVLKTNEHQLDDAKRIASEIGVDRLRFTSAGLPFEELLDQNLAKKWLPMNSEYHDYHPEKILRKGYLHEERCFYLYRAMTVNPRGEVAPCCAVYHSKWDFGNVLESGLKAVWNNSHYRNSRSLFSKKKTGEALTTVCQKCPVFKFEGGGPPAAKPS